jgi:hypothetical protein
MKYKKLFEKINQFFFVTNKSKSIYNSKRTTEEYI